LSFHSDLYEKCNSWLALAVLLISTSATAAIPDTFTTDKAAHFGLSSVAVEASLKTCQAIEGRPLITPTCHVWSSGLVLAAGLIKEVSDQQRGGVFDEHDLVANLLGVVTGNLLQWDF